MSNQRQKRGRGHDHHWSKFELDVVLGLICKGEHLNSSDLSFATKLNEALNGSGNSDSYADDITIHDVRLLLTIIETEKKGSLAFIERQPAPRVMTRTKKRMFERGLSFTGSLQEWESGRRDEWLVAKEMQEADRRADMQLSIDGSYGSHVDRGTSAAAQAVVPNSSTTTNWATGDYVSNPLQHRGQSERRTSCGWTQGGGSGDVATPYGPFHFQTSKLHLMAVPQPGHTPLGAGWTAPNATIPQPNMVPAAHLPWPADRIQAQINTITAAPAQPFLIEQQQQSCTTNLEAHQGKSDHPHSGTHGRWDDCN